LYADLYGVCSIFWRRKALSVDGTDLKTVGGATIGARMPEKNFKISENGCKVCDNYLGHLETN